MKPHVDAIGMKAMTTFRKCTALFIFLKFGQTNSAIDRIGEGFGGESENRERVKNRGIEAAEVGSRGSGASSRGIFWFEIEDETVAAAESTTAASTENIPASVEVKANDENDDEEKDDDGAEHNLAA